MMYCEECESWSRTFRVFPHFRFNKQLNKLS
jgi:hypothetical protein